MPSALSVVHSDPDILGGTPVFVGTRVPFRNLIDYLARNHSLDEFLDAFPSVSREQAVAGLEAASEAVTTRAGFTVLVTGDQNLQFQQNLTNRRLGVVVLCAASNALEDLLPLVPAALQAITAVRPGEVIRVEA